MIEEIIQVHLIFKGDVQRVGFRQTTLSFANQIGLKGTVSNLPDRSVEVYVQGKKSEIDEFIQLLKFHFKNKIFEVVASENKICEVYEQFKII